jgi:Raf kinase inhibitor-like YbhB/YbcL family protein
MDRHPSHKTKAAILFIAAIALTATSARAQPTMRLGSSAFAPGSSIPAKYTCSGENISPPLDISGVPSTAKSLLLVVDDPDAPSGTFDHWVVYNLPPGTTRIPAGVKPGATMPGGGQQARNDFGRLGYGGPCPPPGSPHHYRFWLFALNGKITPTSPDAHTVQRAMHGHVLESAETTGTFGR